MRCAHHFAVRFYEGFYEGLDTLWCSDTLCNVVLLRAQRCFSGKRFSLGAWAGEVWLVYNLAVDSFDVVCGTLCFAMLGGLGLEVRSAALGGG